MQSIYTAGVSNYSMSNLYKPAGIVNITSSYLPTTGPNSIWKDNKGQQHIWNGDGMHSAPTQSQTSVALNVINACKNTFEKVTNTVPVAQNVDYNQNPSAIQCLTGGNTPSTPRGTTQPTGTHF
jgi:hypothetical protein